MAGLSRGFAVVCLFAIPSFAAEADRELVSPNECLKRLHDSSRQRIEWGDLAKQRGADEDVIAFGELLSRRDGELDKALVEYAKANEIPLPDRLPTTRDEPLNRLEGSAFDTAFLSRVAQSNKTMIAFLERSREQYGDATFRRLVNKALATYRDSQRELEKLYENLPAG
jgi:predicted outer membrane protein